VEDYSRTRSEEVYLPAGADWYDFWTNEKLTGGTSVEKETPIDIIPLYVKSGSIVPFGPDVQYAEEKDWSDLEIRVYAGQDGAFVLYEDEKDNCNYERGAYSTIHFKWDDTNRKLIINKREGKFDGMLKERSFNVVLIDGQKEPVYERADYTGDETVLEF
jgi:alpha-D-xyloside xylohydrolase